MKRITNTPKYEGTVVYRIYDKSKELLYVGSTDNLARRLQEHLYDKEWRGQMYYYDYVEIKDASRFETESFHISQLKPKHNVIWRNSKVVADDGLRKVVKRKADIKPITIKKVFGPTNSDMKNIDNHIRQVGELFHATVLKKDGKQSTMRFTNRIDAENWVRYVAFRIDQNKTKNIYCYT